MSENGVEKAPPLLPNVVKLYQRLAGLAEEETDSSVVALQIMDNVLASANEAELFDRQEAGTLGSQEYLNRPFRVKSDGIVFRKSQPQYVDQGGSPFYVLMRVLDMETGEDVVITSGSYSVIAVVSKLLEWDAFTAFDEDGGRPFQFVGKPAAAGTVVMLKPYNIVAATPSRGKK